MCKHTEAVDGARLAELSVLVSASPTEKLITEQLAQMRCDIQQLTGNGTVKDSSITTLATEEVTRSPLSLPRRLRFKESRRQAIATATTRAAATFAISPNEWQSYVYATVP